MIVPSNIRAAEALGQTNRHTIRKRRVLNQVVVLVLNSLILEIHVIYLGVFLQS